MSSHLIQTHTHDGELAVFLIGLRLNKPWRVDLWLPTVRAMGPMINELYAARAAAEHGQGLDPGFRGHRVLVAPTGLTMVQYWRSTEDIYAYAHAPQRGHRPAWLEFYRRSTGGQRAVGIWHETFAVPAGGAESLYLDMPPTGLGAAFGVTDELAHRRHARQPASAAARPA